MIFLIFVSVVGIDLGTTNTVTACMRGGRVHVLADEQGLRLLPSVVSFHPNGEVLVGAAAKARRVIDPKNTVYSHKRLIGRSWSSPDIARAQERLPFELREGPGQGLVVHARGQDYTLPEISAFVLKRARAIAEVAMGGSVDRAVITVPAHFNELQRASTKVAGRVSGLEVLRILNEPTAAALAYGLGRTGTERVAVYDFGGGTFDCTLLDLNGNVYEVLATAGDSFLGGDDVDLLIADRMAESFLRAYRYDPRTDPLLFERLKTTAEQVKFDLSERETTTTILKEFGQGLAGGGSSITFTFTLTRADLEQMIQPLIERSFKVTQDALSLARLTPTSFDKVILVGGSTRIPLVRRRVEAFFGAPPLDTINPDEVVAMGAAIQAAALTESPRRRSIPAPPLPGGRRPAALPQSEIGETTYTGQTDIGTRPRGAAPDVPIPSSASESSIAWAPPISSHDTLPRSARSEPGAATITRAAPISNATLPRPGDFAFADEPSSASVPSFPSLTGAGGGGMPSPLGEPFDDAANFGKVKDLSLISSQTGVTAPAPNDFGQISDLSLVSSSGVSVSTAGVSAPYSDETGTRGNTAQIDPGANPAFSPQGFGRADDEEIDLPSLPADLPAVARSQPPKRVGRPTGQPGMGPSGTAQMLGKPPPVVAPQPFGRMEKFDEQGQSQGPQGPVSRTGAMPLGRIPPHTAPLGSLPNTAALPGRPAPTVPPPQGPPTQASRPPPMNRTAPFGSSPPSAAPPTMTAPTAARPVAKTAIGGSANAPSMPPPIVAPSIPPGQRPPSAVPQAYPPVPPPPVPAPPAQSFAPPAPAYPHAPAYPSAPPAPAYPSAPPPAPGGAYAPTQQQPYVPYPPQPFAQHPSQPPAFGSFGADPAHAEMPQMAVRAPHGLGYASPVLVDVTPRALVVETAGGYADTIIVRNAKIPCERTRRFSTGRDMQTTVRVRVAQGEHPAFVQNTFLGSVDLTGLRPAPRGEVVIAVTFEVDADGTLRVRARDVATGLEARATLQLVGVADESSVVMMINRFAQQPVAGNGPPQ